MSQAKNQNRRVRRRSKKFRSMLVHEWIVKTYNEKSRIADIGGGKGLLSYLLQLDNRISVVIDPEYQDLPSKYTDLNKKRHKIPVDAAVEHITEAFEEDMAKDFDVLIGLHVHGSCLKIINAAKKYGVDFALLPCCVIDEPVEKLPGINWRESLVEYAQGLGFDVKQQKLNFMGKDIVIYTDTNS